MKKYGFTVILAFLSYAAAQAPFVGNVNFLPGINYQNYNQHIFII